MGPEGASPMSTGKNNVPTTDMYRPRKSDRKLACKVWEASGRAIAKMGKKRAVSKLRKPSHGCSEAGGVAKEGDGADFSAGQVELWLGVRGWEAYLHELHDEKLQLH